MAIIRIDVWASTTMRTIVTSKPGFVLRKASILASEGSREMGATLQIVRANAASAGGSQNGMSMARLRASAVDSSAHDNLTLPSSYTEGGGGSEVGSPQNVVTE
jgi:hypothetical protein